MVNFYIFNVTLYIFIEPVIFFVVELYFVLVSYQTIKNKHIRIVKYQENKNEKHQYYWHRTNIMTTLILSLTKFVENYNFFYISTLNFNQFNVNLSLYTKKF